MKCYFNKICQGSLFTIAMLLSSVSTSAVILIIKHGSKANKLSDDASKHAIHRTIAQNITFRLSKEIKKIENSNGSSSQPFISSFVNNSNPTLVVGSRQEAVTDPSALNISVVQKNDKVNNIDDSANFRGRATSKERSQKAQIGYNTNIIDKAIPISSSSVGGYALQVKNVYPDPTDATGKTAKYVLLVKSYACNDGERVSGSCSSSSIMGEYSAIIFAKRTCPVIGGTQLIVADDPGKDFYNLNCTCPAGKTIQANGTCILRCPAGKEISGGSCTNCAAGTYSTAESNTCVPCSGCSGTDCDPTQGCTSCPAGRQLLGNSCTACNAGSWASAGANICTSCLSTERTACSATTGAATSCSAGYGLSGGNCSACTAGTYSRGGASSCQSCGAGVGTCDSSTGTATSCSAGYGLSGGSCSACTAGTYSPGGSSSCQSCTSSAVTSCDPRTGTATGCSTGYTLQGSTCVQACPSNCQTCSSRTTCTQCQSGFYLQPDGSCLTNCPNGTYANISNQKCTNCLTTGVVSCNATTGGATGCATYYGLTGASGAANTTCSECQSNCTSCALLSTLTSNQSLNYYYGTYMVCQSCDSGYQLVKGGQLNYLATAKANVGSGCLINCNISQGPDDLYWDGHSPRYWDGSYSNCLYCSVRWDSTWKRWQCP